MPSKVITELQQSPLPEMLQKLGVSIGQAQLALDRNSVEIARLLADGENGVDLGGGSLSLLELGFAPTFYHITEATIEARVAFTQNDSESFSVGGSIGVNVGFFAASVNASYSNRYSFEATGSSSIRARFVSVPPPGLFSERLRASIAPRP